MTPARKDTVTLSNCSNPDQKVEATWLEGSVFDIQSRHRNQHSETRVFWIKGADGQEYSTEHMSNSEFHVRSGHHVGFLLLHATKHTFEGSVAAVNYTTDNASVMAFPPYALDTESNIKATTIAGAVLGAIAGAAIGAILPWFTALGSAASIACILGFAGFITGLYLDFKVSRDNELIANLDEKCKRNIWTLANSMRTSPDASQTLRDYLITNSDRKLTPATEVYRELDK